MGSILINTIVELALPTSIAETETCAAAPVAVLLAHLVIGTQPSTARPYVCKSLPVRSIARSRSASEAIGFNSVVSRRYFSFFFFFFHFSTLKPSLSKTNASCLRHCTYHKHIHALTHTYIFRTSFRNTVFCITRTDAWSCYFSKTNTGVQDERLLSYSAEERRVSFCRPRTFRLTEPQGPYDTHLLAVYPFVCTKSSAPMRLLLSLFSIFSCSQSTQSQISENALVT